MSESSKSKKIFLSHAHLDQHLVEVVQRLLDKVFSRAFAIFNTSNEPLEGGSKWRDEVRKNLEEANAVLVILTPNSITRDWVFFEAGAAWLEAEAKNKKLIPCLYKVNDFPSPLSEFIGCKLTEDSDVRKLIRTLQPLAQLEPDPVFVENSIEEYFKSLSALVIDNTKVKPEKSELDLYKSDLAELIGNFFDKSKARDFMIILERHKLMDEELMAHFLDKQLRE